MLYNTTYLPTRLWSVTVSTKSNSPDYTIKSTWTTRAEARTHKQELLALGYSSAKIISQRIRVEPMIVDSHS